MVDFRNYHIHQKGGKLRVASEKMEKKRVGAVVHGDDPRRSYLEQNANLNKESKLDKTKREGEL